MPQTSIHLDMETRDKLRAEKSGNETYDDVINRLLRSDADQREASGE